MCSPTIALALGMAGLQAAGTGLQIAQQNKVAAATMKAAANEAKTNIQLLEQRKQEEQQKADVESFERMRQALREEAKVRVAAGEAGALGNSVLRQLNDAMLQAGYDIGLIQTNKEMALRQIQAQQTAEAQKAKGRIKAAKASTMSPLAAGLSIGISAGLGGLQGYTTAKSLKLT